MSLEADVRPSSNSQPRSRSQIEDQIEQAAAGGRPTSFKPVDPG
jgi:hypothetical protein